MVFRFIFTTSIIDSAREQVYYNAISESISILSHLPFEFYIVENNGQRQTMLDDISGAKVLYTNTNNITLSTTRGGKGMKEFQDIIHVADKYQFNDEDIVVKLTGRYTLQAPATFLESVIALEDKYDAFIKWYNICSREYVYHDCILGLYALRYKYLKEFNFINMTRHVSMEHVFAMHIRDTVPEERITEIQHLGLYFQGCSDDPI
jgi:hypothetical protein